MSGLRDLPKIDKLASAPELAAYPEAVRLEAARRSVASLRERLQRGEAVDASDATQLALRYAREARELSLKPAINVSGVILHTGLGRARLAPSAAEAVTQVATSHSLVEFDQETGGRGNRREHVRGLLRELTGAEDALVVNNAAGAVFLTLASLCAGQEVLLSRGQMVEIGGSFRMPDIVRQSGCTLVEVGCTNKTYLRDYDEAICERSAAILRCHPSNYQIVGFTHEPELSDLANLARKNLMHCIDDLGSGCLLDTTRYGMPRQATFQDSVQAGADVVIASGDKLLGGPQAGIIVGKKEHLARTAAHPLARALRVDKLTLAGLEATLRLYRSGEHEQIPVWKYLGRTPDEVRSLAEAVVQQLGRGEVADTVTEVGGGSLPGTTVRSFAAILTAGDLDRVAHRLRTSETPVIGRIEKGRLLLDCRTLEEWEIPTLVGALREALVDEF